MNGDDAAEAEEVEENEAKEDEKDEESEKDTIRHNYLLGIQEKLRKKFISPYNNGTFGSTLPSDSRSSL